MDHNGFSTRDEVAYQFARDKREGQLLDYYQNQGMNDNYPQYGTDFWGSAAENNYGFGQSDIEGNIPKITERLNNGGMEYVSKQAMNNEFRWEMPQGSEYQITMPKPQKPTTWDKFKNWAENTGEAMEAGAVGYATGTTLGNFDEAMGLATTGVTGNPKNYAIGRNAVRQLQNNLNYKHPYIYGGAEFAGAMTTPMHLAKDTTFANKAFNAFTDTFNASAGYAQNWDDFQTNLAVNGIANIIGLTGEKIPFWRAVGSTGKKIVKQGINSIADNVKNIFYNEEDREEFR